MFSHLDLKSTRIQWIFVSSVCQENKEEIDEEKMKVVEKMFKRCEAQHLRVKLLLSRAMGKKIHLGTSTSKIILLTLFSFFSIIFSVI